MTEISTNNLNTVKQDENPSKDVDFPEDLDDSEQRFYKAISPNLTLLQLAPKEETVVKIIHYSRNYK
ncbi:hypothetical protein [uncultured Mucilaginibacter sp.]|uniref:hypothetical protein n=1 Tax=uncultured Mucilaginibacter sp. TaxID=797541 RepID=UPI00262BC07A|nr:hypothetical protein [uncultured Mucilaginibacter sp.]